MIFNINPSDGLCIYRQIVRQIRHAIASGQLKPNEKLPSHRDMASELVISPLTVLKAYETLERDGLIETVRGRGTFVAAESATRDGLKAGVAELSERARELSDMARLLGLDKAGYLEIVENNWDR